MSEKSLGEALFDRTSELFEQGKRAAGKSDCQSVFVGPDHTGDLNYHNCVRGKDHDQNVVNRHHHCGCDHVWDERGGEL